MSVFDDVKRRAVELGVKAAQEIASNERATQGMAEAMRLFQEGRRVVDERGGRVVASLGLATQTDLERVSRKVGRLRKRLQGLLERFEEE